MEIRRIKIALAALNFFLLYKFRLTSILVEQEFVLANAIPQMSPSINSRAIFASPFFLNNVSGKAKWIDKAEQKHTTHSLLSLFLRGLKKRIEDVIHVFYYLDSSSQNLVFGEAASWLV